MASAVEIDIPLDSEGFLRRDCPNCRREFKWHDGPTSDVPLDAVEPEEYYCPYCGEPAPLDHWWTEAQVRLIQNAAVSYASAELDRAFKGLERSTRGGLISATYKAGADAPPPPLSEPDDMVAFASPCHPYEPIKVPEEDRARLHCLVCGAYYTVA